MPRTRKRSTSSCSHLETPLPEISTSKVIHDTDKATCNLFLASQVPACPADISDAPQITSVPLHPYGVMLQ